MKARTFVEPKVFGVCFLTVLNGHTQGNSRAALSSSLEAAVEAALGSQGKALGRVLCVYFSCRTLNSCFGPVTVLAWSPGAVYRIQELQRYISMSS